MSQTLLDMRATSAVKFHASKTAGAEFIAADSDRARSSGPLQRIYYAESTQVSGEGGRPMAAFGYTHTAADQKS